MVNKGMKSDNISSLSKELLVEILCRVGVAKQAIQCKLVCKLWCSLVDNTDSSSYFLQRWRQINYDYTKSLPVTLTASYEIESTNRAFNSRLVTVPLSLGLDFLPPCGRSNKKMCVLGCDKDLVLYCPYISDHSCYYVCNPLTKQWAALPRVPNNPNELHDIIWTKAGIIVRAYDGHFTVVQMVSYLAMPTNTCVFVFSSGGGGWRRIDDNKDNSSDGAVVGLRSYLERRIIWRIFTYKETLVCLMMRLIPLGDYYVCFRLDPIKGQYTPLPLPQMDRSNMLDPMMGVSQGRLRVAEFAGGQKKLIVWEFNEDGNNAEWDKVQEWDLREMELGSEDWQRARARCESEGRWMDVAFHPHDGDVLYMIYSIWCRREHEPKNIIFLCNLKKKKKRPTAVLIQEIPGRYYRLHLFSLVPECWPTPVPLLSD